MGCLHPLMVKIIKIPPDLGIKGMSPNKTKYNWPDLNVMMSFVFRLIFYVYLNFLVLVTFFGLFKFLMFWILYENIKLGVQKWVCTLAKYKCPNSRSSMARWPEGNTREHVVASSPPCKQPWRWYLSEGISKSLTNTSYTNLKPIVHNLEHLVSLFNTKFFYVEIKFTFAKLSKTR